MTTLVGPGPVRVNRLTFILLIMTIVVFNLFYQSTKSSLLGMKCVSKHEDLQIYVLKLNKYMTNLQPLEVVYRGSETQLQLGEYRISTAGCGYKMAVSVTGPTTKLGGPIMPGTIVQYD